VMVAQSHKVLVVDAREKCFLFSKECSFEIILQSTFRGKNVPNFLSNRQASVVSFKTKRYRKCKAFLNYKFSAGQQ